ncbi:MAG: outer membrane protein assembly factor BamD [Omnitrophica bacterium]|nr:outer membrane protein assembly factor BamD [Candidatus Omnitrophota bacterium]
MKRIKVFLILFFVLSFCDIAGAQTAKSLYSQANESLRSDKKDFAFIYFSSIVEKYPESRFAEDALFAVGEYYFEVADYYNAVDNFSSFVNKYPQSQARVFAMAYLLDIAVKRGKIKLIRELEKKIVAFRQFVFLFENSKEYYYLSPFAKEYKVVYFIEKVEFYIDGELFAKIFY